MKIKKNKLINILKISKPFLFIDEIVKFTKNKNIYAKYKIKRNNWFFKYHFINEPVMPGSLLVESMLQTTATLIYLSEKKLYDRTFINKINTNFYKKINFYGELKIISKILNKKKGLIEARSEIFSNKRKICSGNFRYINSKQFKLTND
jgi:3-hydroxyacyl-[acyl-carrier-protein] dehydratase